MILDRSLSFGVKDWRCIVKEVTRLLRPGGLFKSVEPSSGIAVSVSRRSAERCGAQILAWVAHIAAAFDDRGFDRGVGLRNMAAYLKVPESFGEVKQVETYFTDMGMVGQAAHEEGGRHVLQGRPRLSGDG